MTLIGTRRGLSGLEYFQRVLAGEFPAPPMLQLMGIRLVEVDSSALEARFGVGEDDADAAMGLLILDTLARGTYHRLAIPSHG